MEFRFADKKLERLYIEPQNTLGFGPNIVKAFRKVMGFIKDALDEQDFYRMKSLHYEKLKGNRNHQRSLRLNDQFRLIVEIDSSGANTVVIVSIEKHYE
ncbi:MAG TPA: type II toxin-antitoxin system RelE/ParE family toxin [Tepidisphaeraceae bacterium]